MEREEGKLGDRWPEKKTGGRRRRHTVQIEGSGSQFHFIKGLHGECTKPQGVSCKNETFFSYSQLLK